MVHKIWSVYSQFIKHIVNYYVFNQLNSKEQLINQSLTSLWQKQRLSFDIGWDV